MYSLIQYDRAGERGVAALDADGNAFTLPGIASTLSLAQRALTEGKRLAALADGLAGKPLDLSAVRLLLPLDTADASKTLVSGTGLTHLGSAEGRDKMHKAASADGATDSMRMFLMGLEGGKPARDKVGVQPEWFYKGDGSILVGPDEDLAMPGFAEDGSEEPEVAGLYLVGEDGTPHRIGFALGNEFSDHVVERQNYLWLAHSKLRSASLGPELLLGDLPADVRGTSRIRRDGATLWEKPFLTGEANMSHSLANLEHHHFKNAAFRQPGIVHVHFFGTATLSFSDGIRTEPGDIFELEADAFHLPLSNRLVRGSGDRLVAVRSL